jgi:hypothetical protein
VVLLDNLAVFFFLDFWGTSYTVFLITGIQIGVRYSVNVVLIYIYFVARQVVHAFTSFYFDHFDFFLQKSSAQVTCVLFHCLICLERSLVCWAPCVFWLLIPCQMYSWQRFSPFMDCPFSLLTISFYCEEALWFHIDYLPIISLSGETLELHLGIYYCTYIFYYIPCFSLW